MCVWVHEGGHMHPYLHIWRAKVNIRYLPLSLSTYLVEGGFLTELEARVSVRLLSSESPKPLRVSAFLALGLTGKGCGSQFLDGC